MLRVGGFAILVIVATLRAGPVATFQGLGQFDGHVFSTANAISADGSTVVGNAFDETGSQAFRWTRAGGMKSLGRVSGDVSRNIAFDVSADGSTIVGRDEQPDNVQGFWTRTIGMIGAGSPTSEFNAVTANGSTAAGRFNDAPASAGEVLLAGTWTANGEGWHALSGALPDSNAFGISDDGSVVVGVNENHAFRWTAVGGLIDIGPIGRVPTHSIARDVSADGSVVVGDGGPSEEAHAFRWTTGNGIEFLAGPDPTLSSFAYATNADGSVIVGQLGFQHAFIWDSAHGMRDLQTVLLNDFGAANLNGWTLERAFGVSADGRTIVGDGRSPSGNTEAWIATLPGSPAAIPLPAALPAGLLLLGFTFVLLPRRPLDAP
jgi:probable HAF family extracellular repeat protein